MTKATLSGLAECRGRKHRLVPVDCHLVPGYLLLERVRQDRVPQGDVRELLHEEVLSLAQVAEAGGAVSRRVALVHELSEGCPLVLRVGQGRPGVEVEGGPLTQP